MAESGLVEHRGELETQGWQGRSKFCLSSSEVAVWGQSLLYSCKSV